MLCVGDIGCDLVPDLHYLICSGNAGISFGVMSLQDIYKICIPYAISHAWELGRTVIRATRMKRDPVAALLHEEKGSVTVITGKVKLFRTLVYKLSTIIIKIIIFIDL